MYLSELFNQLSYGEFSQLAIGGSSGDGIEPADYHRIVPHVNSAVLELHKRFPLIELEETITMVAGTYTYTLTTTDFIKILKLEDPDEELLTTDDPASDLYVKIIGWNKLEFNTTYVDEKAFCLVTLQGKPTAISLTGLDPSTQEIDIPVYLEEALLYYTAARLFTGLETNADKDKAAQYYAMFNNSCQRVENEKLMDLGTRNLKLEINGWK